MKITVIVYAKMTVSQIQVKDFEEKIIKSKLPVLLDFYAEWCGPCKMAEPVLEELSKTYSGKLEVMKIDVDKSSKLAEKFQVMSIPTTIVFKSGQELDRQIGFAGKESFENLIKKAL